MAKILRLLFIILSIALSFIFGMYFNHKEVLELRKLTVELVTSEADFSKLQTKHKLNILSSIKEGEIDIVEKALINDLKQNLKDPMYTNPENRDSMANKIYEQATLYQKKYCTDHCLGID